jgi:hypothetical protein
MVQASTRVVTSRKVNLSRREISWMSAPAGPHAVMAVIVADARSMFHFGASTHCGFLEKVVRTEGDRAVTVSSRAEE